jgi:hypothetical protein
MSQKNKLEEAVRKASKDKTTSTRTKESAEWMRNKAKTASKENKERRARRRSRLLGDDSKAVGRVHLGGMYYYQYDAKFKQTLPYWDTHPLIFPIEIGDGYVIGLNMHYLPPILRAKLLDAILDLPTYKLPAQRAKMSYSIVRAFAASDLVKPTIHKYLITHIRSNVIEITRDEWDHVTFLPLADFRSLTGSSSLARVYADSRRKIGG